MKDALNIRPLGVAAPLDPAFRPAVLYNRAFAEAVAACGAGQSIGLALEQADGSISALQTKVFPEGHPLASENVYYIERLAKFLLWSRGGMRIHISGSAKLAQALRNYYACSEAGRFDAQMMGERIYEKPFEIVEAATLPVEKSVSMPLGRHLDGCRIGFDLGGSDRKVAAIIDGKCVFSEETVWDPVRQTDPQYHFDGIMDSLRAAAAHLPRVDAIGGSAAGVYVNNRAKLASLFRGIPQDLFHSRVKNLFFEIKRAWNNIPFEIANDGEVTALAGSMSLGRNNVLGIALGTSTAGGYVNAEGNITNWLNELAFTPIDYNPAAPVDEWSGDIGCGALYLSQQCTGRLLQAAGIEAEPGMPLPEKLKLVQRLMDQGDPRAAAIYETVGAYFGYAIAHDASFYEIEHVLILGRVTSGAGGDIILKVARKVLAADFPELSERIEFHTPDEKEKRHGQAIAAASLPVIP
jgi:predicted NBD/HSP70 family sugar kinase